jgi:hypothetical protein
MIAKPELKSAEQRANELFRFMKMNGVVTKEQMCELFGWMYTTNNDRRVREVVALLGTRKPIVATSDKKGYKLATSEDEARHQYNELKSRIDELSKRLKPLEDYLVVGSLY